MKSVVTGDLMMRRGDVWIPSDAPDLEYNIETVGNIRVMSRAHSELGASDLFEEETGGTEGETSERLSRASEVDCEDSDLINWACFVAAYSLRLFIKPAANMDTSWNHMKNRYLGFYQRRDDINIQVPLTAWVSLKSYLSRSQKLITTWVSHVACLENYLDAADDDFELLRYLASLVFGYSNMHRYSLFVHLSKKSKLSPDFFFYALNTDQTADAINQISSILNRYESTIQEIKPSYFKYARLIGPQYFMSLQTKRCPELIYLLV